MKVLSLLFLLMLISACSEEIGEPVTPEPPFFTTDGNASGPLSLAELEVSIPDEIDKDLSDRKRSCFLEAVERRAKDAGDPSKLDPNAFPYWNGKVSKDEWGQHSEPMQRVLLAQAIVSWAMIDC